MIKQALILVTVLLSIQVNAQEDILLTPTTNFSQVEEVYISLLDSTEIIGKLRRVYKEKGLITAIKIKDENGIKHTLSSEKIKFIYLPISEREIKSKRSDFFNNVENWNTNKMYEHLVFNGYTYFESTSIKKKGGNKKVLLQLLNPSFSSKVKVYANPRATKSVTKIGKLIVSSNIKSYYISKEDDFAYKLMKKNYKKEFNTLWNCDRLLKKYPKRKWKNLIKHINDYSECK